VSEAVCIVLASVGAAVVILWICYLIVPWVMWPLERYWEWAERIKERWRR
jgi:hypothetical protein